MLDNEIIEANSSEYFKNELHIFCRENTWIAYGIHTWQIFTLEKEEAQFLLSHQKGMNINNAAKLVGMSIDTAIELTRTIRKSLEAKRPITINTLPINSFYLKFIEHCNMSCSYCYVTYQNGKRVLDLDVGLRAAEVMTELGARGVGIHGGEHLLETEKLMKFILSIRKEGFPLQIGISTNGTLVTDDIARFFRDNDVVVSVGFDGSKTTYDQTKKYSNGTSAYEDALRGAKILKNHGVLAALEMTVSSKHKSDIPTMISSLPDLGVPITVARVGAQEMAAYKDEVHHEEDLTRFFTQDLSIIEDFDECITYGKAGIIRLANPSKHCSSYMCTEILDRVAVDIDGEVYPCPKVKNTSLSLGNVMDLEFKDKFDSRRKSKMTWFSRSKVEDYWFYGLLEMCVDILKTDSQGKWVLSDIKEMEKYYEDIIFERIRISDNKISSIIDKWSESGF